MSIFKQEEPEEEKKDLKTFSRKRDLNFKNKRPKKEEVKPWGKKERLTIFLTFFITVVITGFLFLSSRSWKLPNFPRIEMPDFQILKSETVTIGSGTNIQKEKEDEIVKYFKESTDKLTGTYSFYIIDLTTGYEFGFRGRNVMQAASLIKLPVFASLYQEAESRKIDLDDIYTLKSSDIREGSGSLQYKKTGTRISYRKMAELMGKESDNTSFNVFKNLLGDQKIEKTINDIGMISTSLVENETSAYDISLFFQKLFNGQLVDKKHKDEILGYLTDTFYEDYIPKGILEAKVAHKFGREANVTNDAGIIFSSKPFVLTILSEGIISKEADIFIPEFSKFVFEKMK
ncbi:class A beta-lactamase-related serine hydrolase [Patescibacteria group bacterium]|nr:class A beta-lactamase-related serine hydrolase [Patescibacteria group bacterium]MBU2036133.1 class A beta-lactamase-related serine hydrolase [Patescibacteria group bacterium]